MSQLFPANAVSRAVCVAYGVPFVLEANSSMLLAKMLACVPHGTLPGDAPDATAGIFVLSANYSLHSPTGELFESPDLATVLEELTRNLMIHVANLAPDRVFVHAGVVGWHGRAVVMPGTSFAGKTTLVAELVRAGATYYSDEYAVVDETGLVHPYTRDLQMRVPGRPEQKSLPVAELAGHDGAEPLRVRWVVFAQFRDGGVWLPQPVSAGLAVLEMLRHAIPVQRTPARVMATLAAMMEGAAAWKSERGDAALTARLLLATMDV